jgi:uroporphyrin-III C-methyltransferase
MSAHAPGAPAGASPAAGRVVLVGTGPGDPELLTLRAARLLGEADVVLYDNLVSPAILALLPQGVERIYVGKKRNRHAMAQDAINQMMVDMARSGRRVLRLKGGDPFVFGRGGEELEFLAAAGVRFEVVPGITAATGAAAAYCIPLTHRRLAQSCVFVTGHLQDGTMDLDWPALARPGQTVAVYMGLLGVETLCEKLIAHGRSPDTPAAIIQHASLPGQKIVEGTLATLASRIASDPVHAPTLILVGEVVGLRRIYFPEPRPAP